MSTPVTPALAVAARSMTWTLTWVGTAAAAAAAVMPAGLTAGAAADTGSVPASVRAVPVVATEAVAVPAAGHVTLPGLYGWAVAGSFGRPFALRPCPGTAC